MTEIDVRPTGENLPVELAGDLSALEQWALDASKAHQVAQSLASTSFVPRAMQGKPGEITGAILTGAEMGLQPMAAVRSINIISGTPALSALALRGLVQSRGHEVWVEHADHERVVVAGRRREPGLIGSVKGEVQRSEWTIDRAKRLGLTSKDNWTKQPQAMLTARATSEVCRLIAADVLLGLPYSVEELADGDTDGDPKPKRRSTKTAPLAVVPAPEIEAPTTEADVPEDAEPIAEPAIDDLWGEAVKPGEGQPS